MNDGMPPLVDRDSWQFEPRPDGLPGSWPMAPPPGSPWAGAVPAAAPEPVPAWANAGNTPWLPQAGTPFVHPPVMAPAIPVAPVYAPAYAPVAAPAGFGAHDDWVLNVPRAATPMRSHSTRSHTPFDSPRSDASHISRSRSFHGAIHENVKRPPREWRPDFSMIKPSVMEAALGTIFRSRSLSRSGPVHPPRVTLHPWLAYSSTYPPMAYDVRENPQLDVRFVELNRPTNQWDLTRYVCEPPLEVMTLVSPYFPWYVEARRSNPVGVTMLDLLWTIYQCMCISISSEDYHNCEMDESVREKISLAWSERCGNDAANRNAGVRRVDYLMGRVILRGLVKLKDGTFEMKFKHPQL